MTDILEPGSLRIQVFGSEITEESVRGVAEATRDCLVEVGNAMGYPGLRWKIGPTIRRCDGCDEPCPSMELPAGWINARSLDFCPACLYGGER